MHCRSISNLTLFIVLFSLFRSLQAADGPPLDTRRGDQMIANYFREETAKLRDNCLADIKSLEDWKAKRPEYHQQLMEMLGLDPLPERTDLKATITGRAEHEEFVVENVLFQSRPGLYVTGNLYLPKEIKEPLPAILYVCGHAIVKKDGVSYGGKAHYQHHAGWFARHGYVCLVIDTLQLGEIEGIHHGTFRYGHWWWLNRGYTPTGVEAWNCMRALDYLQSRKEVDAKRLGVTGRSGGGSYSWWIAAIDERIKAAVPVAGITDLENHVVDGVVEGHCDCMFMLNTYRWDYPLVAAMVAPRALLISNTDRDPIFPFNGVVRTYEKVRNLYALYGKEQKGITDDVAINITAGGHLDTQELQMHAFRWFDQHLKNEKRLIDKAARPLMEPEQLRVLREIPADQLNTTIHESFVSAATPPALPVNKEQWETTREKWRKDLVDKSFRGWPTEAGPLDVQEVFNVERNGVRFRAFDFNSQPTIRLRLYLAHRASVEKPELVVLNTLDADSWTEFLATMRPAFEEQLKDETLPAANEASFKQSQQMFQSFKWGMAYIAPRGIGPTAWNQSDKKQTQHRRRFYLLGQTLDGMQVWDVRRAIQAIRADSALKDSPLWLQSRKSMAGVTLYASLFEPTIKRMDLYELPTSHREGPIFLNVQRYLDMPQAVAMAAERSQVVLYQHGESKWEYPLAVVNKLEWNAKQLQLRKPPPMEKEPSK